MTPTVKQPSFITPTVLDLLSKNSPSVNWAYFWDHQARAVAIAHHLMQHPSAEIEHLKSELTDSQIHLQQSLDANLELSAERDALKNKLNMLEAKMISVSEAKHKAEDWGWKQEEDLAKMRRELMESEKSKDKAEEARAAAETSRAEFKEYATGKILSAYSEGYEHALRAAGHLFPEIDLTMFNIDKDVINGQYVFVDEGEDSQVANPVAEEEDEERRAT